MQIAGGPFRAVASTALLFLAAAAGSAAPADDARTVLAPPGWEAGDAARVLDALVGVVERDREGPLAEAALLQARSWWDACPDPSPFVRRLEAVAGRGIPQGDADEALRRTLDDRYVETGDLKKRAAAGRDAGYLGDFLVVGPFGRSQAAAVDVAYPPEQGIDLDSEMTGREGPVRWMPYANLGIGEMIEPFEYLRPTDGTAYALGQVKAKGGPAVLKVTCSGVFKVFLNGADVGKADRLREHLPRTLWLPVTLAEGWNRVLVKVVGNAAFAVKVCDADRGLPLAGFEVEKGRTLHPAVAALGAPGKVAYRSNLAALRAAEPRGASARALRGRLSDSYDAKWDAYEDLKAAAGEDPKDPGVLYAYADFVEDFNELPQPRWRKNRARALYEDVLEAVPGHALAAMNLAGFLHGEDRTEEALGGIRELPKATADAASDPAAAKAAAETRAALERTRAVFPGLDRLLADRPGLARGWLLRARFCQDRSWEKEAEEAAAKATEACPRLTSAWSFLQNVAERQGNTGRVEAICRKMAAVDHGAYGVRRRLAGILRQRGDVEGYLRELRALEEEVPSNFGLRTERAGVLASLRRYDEVLAVYRELARLSPLDFDYAWNVGHYLRLKEDEAGAKEVWRKALALGPGRAVLRRSLERMEGKDYDFARAFDEDAVKVWKECAGQEKYPKAIAVHLLDLQVMRVNEDGSYSTITHDAYKILNEKGREKYQNITVPGQLLEVRAISPEGEVYMPIGAHGNSFTLEGLQAGWLVEYRYLQDTGRNDHGFDSGQWYFQDPQVGADADPVILSRWVVDLPESLSAPMLLRNYKGAPEVKTANGRRSLVFEKRDQDRIEDEPSMPPVDELMPWVHFYAPWTYDEVALEAQSELSAWRATPVLGAKAEEVLRGVQGTVARAARIYAFVNEHVQGTSGGFGATGVLLEASGNRFLLFAAMLRSAGIPFDPVHVSSGSDDSNRWEIVQPGLFDEEGIAIHGEDGRDVYVFSFARHTPFGRLPRGVRGRPALLPGPGGPTLFRMPRGDDAEVELFHDVTIRLGAKPGETTFRLALRNPNDGAYGQKERVKDMNLDERKKEASRVATRFLPTPDVSEFDFPGLETFGEAYAFNASGGLPRQVIEEGGETVVPLGFPPGDMAENYVQKPEREWELVLSDDEVRRDLVTYDLAGKWKVKRLPRGHTTAGRLGTYSLRLWQEEGKVRVERRIRWVSCRYSPDEYREFVSWCKDIDAAEEQRIVLEAAR